MQARDEDGRPMTDGELRDELVTLLLAGHETTATSLAWALERLVRHPAPSRGWSPSDAGEGDGDGYLDAVVNETLRDRPVVPVRRARPPRCRCGSAATSWRPATRGRRRSAVHQPPPGALRGPLRFRPERFLERKPDTYAWIPFGGGIRRCIGAAFAQLEMQIVLQAIMRRADLRAVEAASEPVRRRNITFVPRDKALVEVTGVRDVA